MTASFKMAGGACCCCRHIYAFSSSTGKIGFRGKDKDAEDLDPPTNGVAFLGHDIGKKLVFRAYNPFTVFTSPPRTEPRIYRDKDDWSTHDLILASETRFYAAGDTDEANERLWYMGLKYGTVSIVVPSELYIARVNYDGTNDTTILTKNSTTSISTGHKISYDRTNHKIYYTYRDTTGNNYEVRRVDDDGTNDMGIVAPGLTVWTPSVFHGLDKLYYQRNNAIRRCDLDGANDELIYTPPTRPSYAQNVMLGLTISHKEQKLYWYEYTPTIPDSTPDAETGIKISDPDGTNVEVKLERSHDASLWATNYPSTGAMWLGCGFENPSRM